MSIWSRCVHLALLLWCVSVATPALTADPLARATLQSKRTLYVGQQVLVDVDMLVPNYFLQPPQFPAIDLPGAIVTLQDGRALNLNETIEGTSYSGIRRTYVITTQRDGEFTLPPAEITFGYAAVPGQTTQGKASLPPLRFTVKAAPGGATGGSGVVAAKLTITQDLDRDPKTLKAGDTLLRTITVRAEGLRAMMIPVPEFPVPQGIRTYRQDPVLSEETDRTGQPVAGVRKDVVQYLFQDTGQYELPAIELSWFDPATAATESASAPSLTVSVAATPAPVSSLAPPGPEPDASPFNWLLAGVTAAVALVTGVAIWLLAQGLTRLEEALESRRSESRDSEAALFRHVEQACHNGSPLEIAKTFDRWSRKAGVVPLRPWLVRFGDEETVKAFDAQQQALYGNAGPPHLSGDRLGSGIRKARSAWLIGADPKPSLWRGRILPQLNPSWDGG
ncbi:BatD family protein (plasmid) [Rhizobium sullae]|uniref:BatD family protein n=1 Tax=Rhizobium sullae TaxID=50338 RepID=A0ABY5XQS7_RHISU|nr:BatD family protein [Rhizobium sullae]UWU16855.1 BatD family protein [Rhizobium sullae]